MKTNPLLHGTVWTRKLFREILFYPSRNLTLPLHASSTDGDYNRWVAPTETGLSVTATSLFMIIAQKIPWAAANTPDVAIYDSDNNLRLKFSLNFISFMYLRIYLMKIVFDLWQGGGGFAIVESFWIKSFFILNKMVLRFESFFSFRIECL